MSKSSLIEVFRNEQGAARTRPLDSDDDRAKYLGYLLSDGIQGSLSGAKEALLEVHAIRSAERSEAVVGGNDLELTLNKAGAVLEHLVFPDDPPHHYSLDEVQAALEDWCDLLKTSKP